MKKPHIRHKKPLEEHILDEVDKEIKEVKREWKHLLKFKDENRLLFTSFVILVAALVIVNTIFWIDHSSQQNTVVHVPVTDKNSRVLTSLETGENSALRVSIKDVSENDKKDYAFTLPPTETMLIMNISITNETDVSQQLIPVNQLYVRTDEGIYAGLHASMYVTDPLAADELPAGKTATGQISFNVPKNADRPLLYVDTGWDDTVPLVFDVLH